MQSWTDYCDADCSQAGNTIHQQLRSGRHLTPRATKQPCRTIQLGERSKGKPNCKEHVITCLDAATEIKGGADDPECSENKGDELRAFRCLEHVRPPRKSNA